MTYVMGFVYGMFLGLCFLACAVAHAESHKDGNVLVISKAEKGAKTATVYTVKVNGKEYRIYRGPKGGYFYEIDGKRRYLTAKQKEILNIK